MEVPCQFGIQKKALRASPCRAIWHLQEETCHLAVGQGDGKKMQLSVPAIVGKWTQACLCLWTQDAIRAVVAQAGVRMNLSSFQALHCMLCYHLAFKNINLKPAWDHGELWPCHFFRVLKSWRGSKQQSWRAPRSAHGVKAKEDTCSHHIPLLNASVQNVRRTPRITPHNQPFEI